MKAMLHAKEIAKNWLLEVYRKHFSYPAFDVIPSSCYELTQRNVEVLAQTPNTIFKFSDGNRELFFRECRIHSERRPYLEGLLEDYCRFVAPSELSANFRDYFFDNVLADRGSFDKLFNMGEGTSPCSPVTRFRQTGEQEIIGVPSDAPEWVCSQLPEMVQFMWGALAEYRYNAYLPLGEMQNYNACRSLASKVIADFFGCGDLVPKCELSEISLDGEKRVGIVMERAEGVSPEDAGLEGPIGISPAFQRDLTSLNVLDVICYQKDHRPGNYFVSLDADRRACALSAFDNDCPTAFLPVRSADMRAYRANSPLVLKSGVFNRPYLDKQLSDRLADCSESDLLDAVHPYLSEVQARAVVERLRGINASVRLSSGQSSLGLLDDRQWDFRTVRSELDGEFGMTYLRLFHERYGQTLKEKDLYRYYSPLEVG